jgi:hypothetical protein
MPETPDWAAPPQTTVTSAVQTWRVAEGVANTAALGLSSAGRTIIIAYFNLAQLAGVEAREQLRAAITLTLTDTIAGTVLGRLTIAPESPFASDAPPFGSVHGTVSGDITASLVGQSGGGLCQVTTSIRYYYE